MPKLMMRFLAVLLLATPVLVSANSTNYGNLVGVAVRFMNVTETSLSAGDSVPLYGSPNLSGDSLIFTHMTFSSQAFGGSSDITSGRLDSTIDAKKNPKFYVDSIRFQEFGDTTLAGAGTAATYSYATGSVFITIWETNNVALPTPEYINVSMAMSEGGYWDLVSGPLTAHTWNGGLTVDLTAELMARGIMGEATLVDFSLWNILATGSEAGTSAFIAKKAAGLMVTAEIIPEPGVLSLLLLGGFLLRRRR
jgi:hypothetical protein